MKDLAEKDFISEGAIDVGGVEQGDAAVDSVVNESDHIFFRLGRVIEGGHAHAPKSLS